VSIFLTNVRIKDVHHQWDYLVQVLSHDVRVLERVVVCDIVDGWYVYMKV
jgi:hypothetical protein